MGGQRREIVGVVVHVTTVCALARAAMAAAVIGDDAKAAIEEEQHLRVPIVGRQRPAMADHDGLAGAPVLVENLGAVFGGDRGASRTSCFTELRGPSQEQNQGSAGASVRRDIRAKLRQLPG